MGSCISSSAAPAEAQIMTAKLILPDGDLREFSWPIKASHALQKDPDFFVCDSDDMEFDRFIPAIRGDEELQLGQIYFMLPRSMQRKTMRAEDLAELALKARSALMRAVPEGKGTALVFSEGKSPETSRKKRAVTKRGFKTNLSAIPE